MRKTSRGLTLTKKENGYMHVPFRNLAFTKPQLAHEETPVH